MCHSWIVQVWVFRSVHKAGLELYKRHDAVRKVWGSARLIDWKVTHSLSAADNSEVNLLQVVLESGTKHRSCLLPGCKEDMLVMKRKNISKCVKGLGRFRMSIWNTTEQGWCSTFSVTMLSILRLFLNLQNVALPFSPAGVMFPGNNQYLIIFWP